MKIKAGAKVIYHSSLPGNSYFQLRSHANSLLVVNPLLPWSMNSFQPALESPPAFKSHFFPLSLCILQLHALREASQILWWGFFHGTGMCQDVTCLLWASLSGKHPFISYRLKLYLPKIRKHHNIVTKHQRGDTLILLNPFCPGQRCVMSSTPEVVCHGEKRNSWLWQKGCKNPHGILAFGL